MIRCSRLCIGAHAGRAPSSALSLSLSLSSSSRLPPLPPPLPLATTRCLATSSLARLSRPVQSYISSSRDPYINLSIEHHILQTAHPESAILFLYVNRPSVIIGRNQNPWLEVNLALLNSPSGAEGKAVSEEDSLDAVDLVRRRSGGGTVFHDGGNVNWTVISPAASFTRDKHAEMVVRARRRCGGARARVNPRHDIVLDQGEHRGRHDVGDDIDLADTHATPFQLPDAHPMRPRKVSGSAYKLTRRRALHHGTCLLSSPNLHRIPHYLHSPAKPFISARGVESVSSPVSNILLSNEEFIAAVQTEFAQLYGAGEEKVAVEISDDWLEDESVSKGYHELKSRDWIFLQTPQFTLSTPLAGVGDAGLELGVRHGVITEGKVFVNEDRDATTRQFGIPEAFLGQRLHEISDWESALGSTMPMLRKKPLAEWLARMLPVV